MEPPGAQLLDASRRCHKTPEKIFRTNLIYGGNDWFYDKNIARHLRS